MNLIRDKWIPVSRVGEAPDILISPVEIGRADWLDISAMRPDFRGALYQFLIGLLQTGFAPPDHEEWLSRFEEAPRADELGETLQHFETAFEFDAQGPAFMQDFDLPDGIRESVSRLLIDAPAGKTLDDNKDHFVRRGRVESLCRPCAAAALFTLQINAPKGGAGHRTSLRGGGPLTTLVRYRGGALPDSLWRKVWINVIPGWTQDQSRRTSHREPPDIFPWLAPTRTSDKAGVPTLPGDAHPLQMYWSMPRRIRLEFEDSQGDPCDLCGEEDDRLVRGFRAKNYGINYEGSWVHPLTPHRHSPEKPPLPFLGKKGGLTYRDWLAVTMAHEANESHPAAIVDDYLDEKAEIVQGQDQPDLWCFGYHMVNMKARCWYESSLPLLSLSQKRKDRFFRSSSLLVEYAVDACNSLRRSLKSAWFKRPKDARGDFGFVDARFWSETEGYFYRQVHLLAFQDEGAIFSDWMRSIRRSALKHFDDEVLGGQAEDLNMQRIAQARRGLEKALAWSKTARRIKKLTASEVNA